jgi:MoaA/NifB/PqqE/SkfB family radical SAM enzyme
MLERPRIRLSYACNNACWSCPNRAGGERATADVVAEIAGAADGGARAVHLFGGELFVHPGRAEIVRAITDRRIAWSMETNGRVFAYHDKAAALRRMGLDGVTVRVHASNGAAHASVTRDQGLQQTLSGIRNLDEAGLLRDFEVPVTRENRGDLCGIAVLLRQSAGPRPIRFVAAGEPKFQREIGDARRFLAFLDDPASRRPGDDVVFAPAGRVERFDPTRCPVRSKQFSMESPLYCLFVERDGGYDVYRAPGEACGADVVVSKNVRHLVARARADGGRDWFDLHPSCRVCPELHGCFGCFVPDRREREPEVEGAPRLRDAAELPALVREGRASGELRIRGAVPVCWLGEAPASDARPVAEPWLLADYFRASGGAVVAYETPSRTGRPEWALTVRFDDEAARSRQAPSFVLFLASACIARCVMCDLPAKYAGRFKPFPEAVAAIEEIKLCGAFQVDLFGGEITLRRDLAVLVRLTKELNLLNVVISTGWLLAEQERVDELMEAGVDRFEISIDSARDFLHDHIRNREGLFDRATAAIQRIVADGRAPVAVNTVILRQNADEVVDIHRLASSLGVKKHMYFYCVALPGMPMDDQYLRPETVPRFFRETLPSLEDEAHRQGTELFFGPEVRPADPADPEFVARVARGEYTTPKRCHAIGNDFLIALDGGVLPCQNPGMMGVFEPVGFMSKTPLSEIVEKTRSDAELREKAGFLPPCTRCICPKG